MDELTKKVIEKWLKEFKETGTVLACGTEITLATFEKHLLSEHLWYSMEFEAGCSRFEKSDVPPY